VWELSDRHRLEEKRLRYVLKVQDEALQVQLVRMIVDRNLSAERVQRLVESGELTSVFAGYDWAAERYSDEDILSERVANRWFSLARQVPQANLTVVADEWLRRQTPEEVRQQVAALRRLLEIVEERVQD
jgi:hypothetical protein